MIRRSWLISLAISLFGVMMVEHFFTLKVDENNSTGTNLGIFGLALVIPFLLLSLFITVRYFIHYARTTKDKMMRTIVFIFTVAFIAVVGYFAIDYRADVYVELGGSHQQVGSKIYGMSLLNEYTNRIFFNLYTFFFVHSIAAVIGMMIGILKPNKPENALPINDNKNNTK